MWKLRIGEKNGNLTTVDGNGDEYLFSTNNFVGRQIWEFDPDAGTQEEHEEVESLREQFLINKKKLDIHCCGDLLMRAQLIKESGIDLMSEPPVRLGDDEEVNYEAVTTAVKKAVQLNRAIQAWDGHWPAENAGPLFFIPPLIIAFYISGTLDTILTKEHKKEMIRYMYIHQNEDGGWGFYISGKSTMIGSALNYVALRLLGEASPDDDIDGDGALARGRKWILDHGGATSIPSWGKVYLSVLGVYGMAAILYHRNFGFFLPFCLIIQMAQPENTMSLMSAAFKDMIGRDKLTGPNFNDWHRSLRIILRVAKRVEILTTPLPNAPLDTATALEQEAYRVEYEKHNDVACLMISGMSAQLQKQFEHYPHMSMLDELKRMFEKPPAAELYELIEKVHSCKQEVGKSVSDHVLEMKHHLDQLEKLGCGYSNDVCVGLINHSLNQDRFGDFVRNFNMHCTGKTVNELHAMLVEFEKRLPKKAPTPAVLAIQGGRVNKPKPQADKKGKGKGKGKQVVIPPAPKKNPGKKKENPKKDLSCHHCNSPGHGKRNCPVYLNECLQNKNKMVPSSSGT